MHCLHNLWKNESVCSSGGSGGVIVYGFFPRQVLHTITTIDDQQRTSCTSCGTGDGTLRPASKRLIVISGM